ncbi:MAG: polyprenyl synthetase family protein [Pelagimonas sp.]|jgi:farnesyl diphosphate synthase|nr:polyprenyl synthetase family protein [Pelagimonas sp.]
MALTMVAFPQALARAGELSQRVIAQALAGQDDKISQAMGYAVEGGKGLRAFLALESARLHGISAEVGQYPAAAIEAMHAYSLVHDDMPCMDDDDLRRGKPTVHRKWDEATAVLAGDALQSLSFELLCLTDCAPQGRLALIQGFAQAAGVRGMVGGQAMDMAAETSDVPLTLEEITRLQAGKTGALINWSCEAGPMMTGSDASAMHQYGSRLGLAFQIWDDVLDVEGCAKAVGKAVGKDAGRGKATFVSLLGLDEAKRRASELVEQACDSLSVYHGDADCLREAARFVISRSN